MKTLYFDTVAGISGDMTVGALLSLGMPLEHLRQALGQLPLGGYAISATQVRVNAIAATKFDVSVEAHGHGHHDHSHRAFRDIRAMIDGSGLGVAVKRLALGIFTKLAEAEAHVHAVPPDDVEFHEVGAVDSIVDIIGAAIGFTFFAVESAYVGAIPLGSGIVQTQHGPLPIPGPATTELLRGFNTRLGDGLSELVTPTGAAIVASLATPAPMPPLRIEAVGYGAGQRRFTDRPNVLRLVLGETAATADQEELIVIEANIDDLNPELYDHVMERLLAAGARDVYLTPVHMKKNRPGIVVSVLCDAASRERLATMIFSETSTIGVRFYPVQRQALAREMREVMTVYGSVRVKVARSPQGYENLAPEYEDCKRVALEKQVPLKLVYQAALTAAVTASRA